MEVCQNQVAAVFALPEGPMPVRDRKMTLQLQCKDSAAYSQFFRGVGNGKGRTGAAEKSFLLCENHSQLFSQIDRELSEDGWARSTRDKPVPL